MRLEHVLQNIRSIPEENKEQFVEAAMDYFPIMVELIDRCWYKLGDFKEHYIDPAERKHASSEDELPLEPELDLALDHCEQMNRLLVAMFQRLGVNTSAG